jgi:predicted DNA-binding antitoxin AbrB/MazE fold protein
VIRLTDESGDVLLDTGEKPESSKDIDSNGNTKEYPTGLSQRRRYKQGERRNDEQRVNEAVSEGAVLGKFSEQKHTSNPLKKLSLDEGEKLKISERYHTEAALEAKRSCKKRGTRCLQSSLHSVSGKKSQSEGCIINSQCKEKSRNKVHRRGLQRRRNRRYSSTSSDSSSEVRRRTRHRSKARGRTAAVSVAL